MVYHNITQDELVRIVMEAVMKELNMNDRTVPVGISVRHIHLTREHVDRLFGYGYKLTPKKALSQPGQFACEETLEIVGPKGSIKKVRILGPERKMSQVELSKTDARTVGLNPPVRSSGDIKDTPGIKLIGPKGSINLNEGVIIADRHIHMTPQDAMRFGVTDKDRVSVRIDGVKPGIMEDVVIRVSDKYKLDFHVDTDDGNAFMMEQGQRVTVLEKR
ncbi:MAG: phosphate propanoyltransferase [Lachnospiraceae bacterium]|nr:phosphate propanoyltransferase [Lachnospiraceae bacterium]